MYELVAGFDTVGYLFLLGALVNHLGLFLPVLGFGLLPGDPFDEVVAVLPNDVFHEFAHNFFRFWFRVIPNYALHQGGLIPHDLERHPEDGTFCIIRGGAGEEPLFFDAKGCAVGDVCRAVEHAQHYHRG